MSDFVLPLLDADRATLLTGPDLHDALLAGIESATERCWACFFIASVQVDADPALRVRRTLDALARAAHRGADVRVLLDRFQSGVDDFQVNLVAAHYLGSRSVDVRMFAPDTTHSKYLLVDGWLQIVGSGNLSAGGLSSNVEMAVRVESVDLGTQMERQFAALWAGSLEVEPL